jgi:5-methyltetrahydropteroyltriglutamate--homocysteine methyltransferase
MKRSIQRILTTHTGSLPRPARLLEMIVSGDMARLKDDPTFQANVRSAVAEMVRLQTATGIDVINDGEQSKANYGIYIKERLTGFGGTGQPMSFSDLAPFPEYYERVFPGTMRVPMGGCSAPVSYAGLAEVDRDIANFKAAAQGARYEEAFITAASPGIIAHFLDNEFYPSDEKYLMAVADAMRVEYERLHQAGFIVQLDCPDLAMARCEKRFANASLNEFQKAAELHVEAINRAVAAIPPESLRMHICWGNYEGPHHHDVELKDIIDIVLQARPAGIVLEACNPRHEHEWQVFEQHQLPHGKVLIPGVIDTVTNFVEHPELVAQRIERWARVVGRENVIAGTDCGFASGAAYLTVFPDIAWLKLRSLVEGARLASSRLWR